MGTPREQNYNTVITSPAIARVMKEYKHYVGDCIREREPIDHFITYYFKSVRRKKINKSRIIEEYLSELSRESREDGT